jgi:class 3 adenylate cyclase/pimeloyl-ACP methyl ester carboxylesterase
MEREIRYCSSGDGVSIAYCVEGDTHLPPLVWVPGWVSHLELDGQARDGLGITDILRTVRFVTLDKRGTGLSSRNVGDFSLDARVSDLAAVVDDLGLTTFALAGWSEGGPVALGFAARYPDRVTNLTIVGSFANGAGLAGSREMGQALLAVVKAEWGVGSKLLSDFFVAEESIATADGFAAYQRVSANPTDAFAALSAIMDLDARPLLAQIKAPTLVIHTRDDRVVPIELGQEIAAGIRGARFISLPGAHVPAALEWLQIHKAMIEFVTAGAPSGAAASPPVRANGGTRTVLFTDIVGHTEMMQRLGDAKGRDLLREHERITRDTLKHHGGAEVKTMGDGFMASFGSVTRAMECAIALQRAFAEHNAKQGDPLSVRVGLNAGEPIEEDGDLFGSTVILASRIAAKAGGGEILVPETVRGLLSGKGFMFGDRGEFVPKGFDEGVRLWDVRWQD